MTSTVLVGYGDPDPGGVSEVRADSDERMTLVWNLNIERIPA